MAQFCVLFVEGICHIVDFRKAELLSGSYGVGVVMYVPVSDALMMDYRVMFSMVISIVGVICMGTLFPVDFKMTLAFPDSQPEVPHIPRLCSFYYNIVVSEGLGGGVVCFDGSRRLRMAHQDQSVSYRDCSLAIME